MKVAAAQISCALGDFDANLRKIRDFATRAKKSGAELVVFPEMSDTGYSMPVIQKHARPWKDGAVAELQKIAKENSIALVAGISDREDDSIFNAQVLVNAKGEILAKYRKTHLVTAAPLDERVCLSPGKEFVAAKIENFNVGLSICYDLRFPEMARTLAVKHGAKVIVNSSAWPDVRALVLGDLLVDLGQALGELQDRVAPPILQVDHDAAEDVLLRIHVVVARNESGVMGQVHEVEASEHVRQRVLVFDRLRIARIRKSILRRQDVTKAIDRGLNHWWACG